MIASLVLTVVFFDLLNLWTVEGAEVLSTTIDSAESNPSSRPWRVNSHEVIGLGLVIACFVATLSLIPWKHAWNLGREGLHAAKVFSAKLPSGLRTTWIVLRYCVLPPLHICWSILYFCMAVLWVIILGPYYEDVLIRGRRVIGLKQARAIAARELVHPDLGIWFAGLYLPMRAARCGLAIIGATGSGKTAFIERMFSEVFCRFRVGKSQRALILDTKVESMSYLQSLDIKVPIHLLHPLDERSKAWDIAKDCRTPAAIEQLVSNLVPEEQSSNNRFFTDATRELMRGAIQFLVNQSDSWSLRDLLLLLSNLDNLKLALAQSPSTAMALQVMGDEVTARNVFATLTTVVRRYETVAAAWATAKERISVTDWVNSDSILVLGLHEQLRHPLSNIYRVFLQLATEALLDKPETPDVQTFVILDEVRHAGKQSGLRSLCTNGRSRGTSVTLGFQDIEGMREVFGANEANELVGQCGHVALLRIQSPATAEYASALLGSADWREYHVSRSKQGSTTSEQVVTRPLILPGQFMGMPQAGPRNGTPGVFASMNIGVWTCSISSQEIFPTGNKPRDPSKNFWPRPSSAQTIKTWTPAEIAKLGLQRTQQPPPAAAPDQASKKLTFVGKCKPRV